LSNDITCNVNGNIVPSGVQTCNVNAGDSIKVQWDSSTHPGPITHFLYGPVSDASQATGIGNWVKIDEFDSQGGEWANQIMEAANMTYTFKLPTNLATGDYLLRGEMEALHVSEEVNGTQFYIGCAQIHITGNGGSCGPSIKLPGAYHSLDTDIYISNFYNGFNIATFSAPGGPVATCAGGNGGSSPVTTTAKTTTPISTITPTTTKAPTTSGKPTTKATTTLVSSTSAAAGTVPKYGQCGGSGYTGPTACVAGSTCTAQNQYYSQCV
jgi:lytic cellulose monooxygenase (C1-hydroxylating)